LREFVSHPAGQDAMFHAVDLREFITHISAKPAWSEVQGVGRHPDSHVIFLCNYVFIDGPVSRGASQHERLGMPESFLLSLCVDSAAFRVAVSLECTTLKMSQSVVAMPKVACVFKCSL
jgi:hypothetical protein